MVVVVSYAVKCVMLESLDLWCRVRDGTRGAVEARHLGMWSEEKGLEKCRGAANMTDLS